VQLLRRKFPGPRDFAFNDIFWHIRFWVVGWDCNSFPNQMLGVIAAAPVVVGT
jgi:hypothetical protein